MKHENLSRVYDWLSIFTTVLALVGMILWMIFIDKDINKSTFPFFVTTAACCVITAILCVALMLIKEELDTYGLEGFFLGFLLISYVFMAMLSIPFLFAVCWYI